MNVINYVALVDQIIDFIKSVGRDLASIWLVRYLELFRVTHSKKSFRKFCHRFYYSCGAGYVDNMIAFCGRFGVRALDYCDVLICKHYLLEHFKQAELVNELLSDNVYLLRESAFNRLKEISLNNRRKVKRSSVSPIVRDLFCVSSSCYLRGDFLRHRILEFGKKRFFKAVAQAIASGVLVNVGRCELGLEIRLNPDYIGK